VLVIFFTNIGARVKRIVILLLGLAILFGGNCTKNPTGPGGVRGPILYAITSQFSLNRTLILFIDTTTDSLVDSMAVPYGAAWGWGASPDGSTLYLLSMGRGGAGGGVEIDTRTKTVKYAGPLTGRPTPDGKFLICSDSKSLKVIDAKRRKVLFEDSIPMIVQGTGWPFDPLRGLVYAAYLEPGATVATKIGVFDYRKLKLLKIIDPAEIGGYGVAVNDLVLTNDGNKLYYTASFGLLTGIDLRKERVITLLGLNALSWLGITPDDRYLYLTDPGGGIIPPSPTGKIGVYSPDYEKPLESIDVCQQTDLCLVPVPTNQIAISASGKKAYVTSSDMSGCSVLLVIDTRHNLIRELIRIPQDICGIGSLAVQPPSTFRF